MREYLPFLLGRLSGVRVLDLTRKCWQVKDWLSSEIESGMPCRVPELLYDMQGLFQLWYRPMGHSPTGVGEEQGRRYFTGKSANLSKLGTRKYPLLILVCHPLVYVVPSLESVEGCEWGWLGV